MKTHPLILHVPEELMNVIYRWPTVAWDAVFSAAVIDADWRMNSGAAGLVPQIAPPTPAAPPEVKP